MKPQTKSTRADYTYTIINECGRDCICIIDECKGNMSLTNNMKQVVKEIGLLNNINPEQYMIVYRDSELIWDGYDCKKGTFVPLQLETETEAIKRYIDRQLTAKP